MTVAIHTYSNPTEWKEHPLYASFPDAVHVCATRNQRDGIRSCYETDIKHIYSFREFIKKLYPRWYSAESQVQQLLRLNKLIADLNGVKPDMKQAFRKNAMEILESIRFFTEAGVHPHSLADEWLVTEKEQLFKEIWNLFAQEDQTVRKHIQALQKPLLQKDLKEAIRSLSKDSELLSQELHFVFHGFYFVTPEQQTVLKMIRQQQVRITFFHYYDGRFADTFDFIKSFYTDRFGWPSSEEWIYDKAPYAPVASSAYAFFAAYEQLNWNPEPLKESITAYGSFFDFLYDVIMPNFEIDDNETPKRKAQVISPNADELNKILTAYYPQLNAKKRNFLSYPIGRFFVSIHEIYDNGNMRLNEHILTDLFSSGWIFDKSNRVNAQDYMYDLYKLFPYLQGCSEIKEWTGRLDQLIKQGLMIEQVFPISRENRIVRSMRSPFSKIGHFAVPLHRVKQVKQFIESIQLMTKMIFGQSGTSATINQHFKRLKEFLVENRSAAEINAEKEEKEIVRELEERLSLIQDDTEFLFEDLKDALHYYLSGKLDDNDENFINGFIEIDGEIFKEHELPIYLTGLDEHSLPLSEQTIPWPLQTDTFEQLCQRHVPLQLHSIRNRAGKAISRYLFFIALNLAPERMNLSWIKNISDQHELQRALYVKQLGLKVIEFNFNTKESVETLSYVPHKFTAEPLKNTETTLETFAFEDFLAEYKLCPKRFYYSYITDEYPVFSSEFMHQFLYSEIIKTAKTSTKANFDSVFREVSPFFPQWPDFKKRFSAKTAFQYAPKQLGQITQVEETASYTETRKNFQFPGLKKADRERLLEESKRMLSESLHELRSGDKQTLPAKAGYHCRFCPHIDYCDNAAYGIDLQREED
ncbi:hypothetical protein [Paenibacillus lactis]|uniref:hypothetical protein n=1 Tax=Paenibacillus lactis TaxID=228574 RepID=UPI001B2B6A9C|nr:hypothetical protein [Paenibacillus lactis]GIO91418.1 hypothetical protein J31TS3_26450 [Paenibacillus lactis]